MNLQWLINKQYLMLKKYKFDSAVLTINMQQFLTILAFYRPFVLWSLLVNIAITIVNPYMVPAIATKLLLAIFVWFIVTETNARRKLTFYKNLGISPIKLFSVLYIVDIFITITFLIVIKEYV